MDRVSWGDFQHSGRRRNSRTMPEIIVYYFPLKDISEGIRLLLDYARVNFEDRTISMDESLDQKPTMQIPDEVLEVGSKKYVQSVMVERNLGHKYGLAGTSLEEDFQIDQNIGFWTDIYEKAALVFHEQDDQLKAEKKADLEDNYYPIMLRKLDEMLKQNNGYMALGRLTWADFVFAGRYAGLKQMTQLPDLDEKYPRFKELEQTVYSIPKVEALDEDD